MFFLKQLGSLLDAVKEIDPDANPSVMIKFMLPNGTDAKAVYVHNSFDGEGDSQGSIVLYYGDNKTEFDSLQYTIDGINSLCGSTGTNTAAPNNVDKKSADELTANLDMMSADELAGDLVTYLYDKYKGASYIGEKELDNGAIALRFEWGNDFKDIAQDLTERYGDRITFIRTRSQYAPEQTASGILVAPPKAAHAVTESIVTDKFELVENFPVWAIEPLVNDSWGDYLQYNGEELAREDFSDIDNFMTTHGYCGIHAPSDELYDQTHSEFTSRPAFGKSTETCSVYAVKGPWKSLMKEYGLDTAAPVTEATDGQPKELTEDCVQQTIESFGLQVINKWYDGNKSRPVFDCKTADGRTLCVWNEPPYEAKIWFKDADPRDNGLVEDIDTLEDLKANLSRLAGVPNNDTSEDDSMLDTVDEYDVERSVADSIDTAMMDHYDMMNGDIGDFESVEFYKDVKSVCEIAGKPALAEAVIKLYKAYHPVLEAGEAKPHVIPEEIAKAVNNAQAEDYGWRPETAEHAFEGTWDWLEDHADTVLDAWNATNDPREVIKAVEGDEEELACMFDGI